PDGARLVFGSNRDQTSTFALYEKPSNGAVPERLLQSGEPGSGLRARDWSPDGRLIVLEKILNVGLRDLWVLPLSDNPKLFPYLTTSFDKSEPAFSPNGRWLAYVSNESGQYQVIVQPFPDPSGGKWQIST